MEPSNDNLNTEPFEKAHQKHLATDFFGKARDAPNAGVIATILFFIAAVAFAGLVILCTISRTQEWLNSLFPSLDRMQLKVVICAIEFSGSVLLFFLFKNRRNLFDLYLNAYIPVGIIITPGILKCYWWMSLLIPIVIFLYYLASLIITALTKEKKSIRHSDYICCALAILSIVLLLLSSFGGLQAYSHTSKPTELSMTLEEAEKQHREACRNLEKEVWGALTAQEKLDLLQAICDYECEFVLGCEKIRLYSGLTNREGVLGEYSEQSKSFTINEEHLIRSGVEDVIDTVLHEIRHAYQYALIDAYLSLKPYIKDEHQNLLPFQQAREFSEEFGNYCSGEDDFYKYFLQEVEKDSRAWATKRMKEFYIRFIYPDR